MTVRQQKRPRQKPADVSVLSKERAILNSARLMDAKQLSKRQRNTVQMGTGQTGYETEERTNKELSARQKGHKKIGK